MITIVSTFTVDPITKPLQLLLNLINRPFEIKLAPYTQIFQQLLDENSLFMQNNQGINIILIRFEDWLSSEYRKQPFKELSMETSLFKKVNKFLSIIKSQINIRVPLIIGLCQPSPMICDNLPLRRTFEAIEKQFQDVISQLVGVYLMASEDIKTYYPVLNYHNSYTDKLAHIPYTENYFVALAAMLTRKIHAIQHAAYKVIVLDCDNTLWQGICGEVEDVANLKITQTQQALQRFIIQQQQIGVLICLCSKNNEADVWAVFDKHPDMLLKREYITLHRINWQEKVVNIAEIAQQLNLSLNSFIFIDDNSHECMKMQQVQPMVLTIQCKENTLPILQHIWGLDKLNVTQEDRQRTASYQQKFLQSPSVVPYSLRQFVEELQLEVSLLPLTTDISQILPLQRAAELTRKTNQFNCTTQRFTDKQLQQLINGIQNCLTIHIKDNERNYGLKGVIIYEIKADSLEVANFLLSCEVLGRGAEHKILNELGCIAKENKVSFINFHFIPTDRNEPAENFLASMCDSSIKVEQDHGAIFSISTENACCIQYAMTKNFVSSKEGKKRSITTIKNDQEQKHYIDYLRIANEFSTVEQILSHLKQASERSFFVNIPCRAPKTLLEKKLLELWEESLNLSNLGCTDNFTQLGGDSIKATLLLAKIYLSYGIEIQISDVLSSTVSELASLIEVKEKERGDLKQTILREREGQLFPLSFAQQRLWFLDQLQPHSSLYNMFIAFELKGNLSTEALKQSFLILIKRHESLRTAFIRQAGQACQTILAYTPELLRFNWDVVAELSDYHLRELARQEAQQPFQLDSAPLLRVRILESTPDRYILMLCMHHIIHDGWSFHIFCKELIQVYSALVEKNPINLPEKLWDYIDFSHWQEQSLNAVRQQQLLTYWTEQLAEFSPVKLPLDYTKSDVKHSYTGDRVPFSINMGTLTAIKKIAQTNQATLFTTLFSVFTLLIGRYAGQEDLSIGTPISGRHSPNLENIIGFFVNILVLRVDMSTDPTFQDFLQRNKETILKAYEHQDLPFEKLVSALNPVRGRGENPLANIMFIFQNYPLVPLQLPGLSCQRILSDNESLLLADYESAKVDLSLYVQETASGLQGLFEYNTTLFHRSTIERLITQFGRLLQNVTVNPSLILSKLSLLDEEESYRLMAGLSTHKRDYPITLPLCTLLQQQVVKTPNSIALSLSGETTLSYQQLNEAANQLAHHLIKLGLQRKQVIGIYLDRSFDLMISLLALWKAGVTPVCIDPNYPKERIRFIVNDCQPAMLISQGDFYSELKLKLNQPNEVNPVILDLNREQSFVVQQSTKNLSLITSSDEVLYIIYTSGSTGEPKGVLIEQQGVINMAYSQIDELKIHSQDHILQFARPTFDAFFWETLGAWLAGAQLCLIPKEIKLIGNDLVYALKTESISIATLTPSVVETIPEGVILPDLRCLVLAGEAPSVATVERWSKYCQVINAYGPSEATVCASLEKVDLSIGKLGIGKPLANVEIYLLDANLQPVAIGIPGEIFIGGIGVARGYLNRRELTQNNFLTVLLNGKNKQLYKTGDKARWLKDGRLEFLGRINKSQVKLRGFRIELGEIKQQLLKHPAIDNAVIKVYDQHLIAYLVTNSTIFSEKDSYLSHITDQTQQWQILHDELYQQLDVTQPLNFNCLGWNSSYTKKPFLEEEMKEWIDTTVKRILFLKPKRVLEIGCGAGLLMARIAPYCDFYMATDFSAAVIHYLEKLKHHLGLHEKIQLLQRPANIFNEKEHNYYDVIIINSVIQYFPDSEYLIQVIEGAICCLQPGGKLFIGDIRSLIHLEMFHRIIMLHHMDLNEEVSERVLVEKIEHEEELLVHTDFFEKFAQSHPLLECVITQARRGKHINELTQFRYDITLLKKGPVPLPILDISWSLWDEKFTTQEDIQEFLLNQSPVYLAIQGIPNVRLCMSEFGSKAMGLSHQTVFQANPENFFCLAEKLGYQAIINWSKLDPLRFFDIVFYRSNELVNIFDINSYHDISLHQENWSQYVNQPQKNKIKQGVLIDLKKKIKEMLPDYMIPANWYFIDQIPLTSHGKIDDKALRMLGLEKSNYIVDLPTTDIEEKLSSIWKSCLHRDKLGINDNFFEIGGESLRAVELITRINEAFTIELPIKTLIDTSTIKKLGEVIEKQQSQKEEASYSLMSSVITLKQASGGLPLFLIHPVGGTIFCYKNLVERLNFSGPCYAIQDPSIIAKKIFLSSIDEMASSYIRLIKLFQAKGPYKIAGHSFGGTVAVEIARQLMQIGEEVQFVALFDTWASTKNKNKMNKQVEKMLIKQYEEKKHSQYSAKFFQSTPPIDLSFWIKLGADRIHLALNHQFPKNLNFPLILFKAEESVGKTINNQDSPTNYWNSYSSTLKVHSVSGNHESILEYPHVNKIASLIDSYLNVDYKPQQDETNAASRCSMNY